MLYESRARFEAICKDAGKVIEDDTGKYAYCNNSFWQKLHPNDVAISDNIERCFYWEPWDAMAISNMLDDHRAWTFLDIGANIGYYSMLGAAIGVETHSFECNPDMIPYIKDSAKKNNFYIDIHDVAIGDTNGLATLSISSENFGGSSLHKLEHEESSIEVQVTTLDNEAQCLNGPFIAKVDVEGYERNVWWGSKCIREKYSNIWFVEWFNSRWSEDEQRAFLEEVSQTHHLRATTYTGHIVPKSIDQIIKMGFATLVFESK